MIIGICALITIIIFGVIIGAVLIGEWAYITIQQKSNDKKNKKVL